MAWQRDRSADSPAVEGTYLLARQVNRVGHYARVRLTLVEQAQDEVSVAPAAFDWLRQVYGPDASVAPYRAEFGPEAVAGVLFGLRQVGVNARVMVSEVHVNNVDTSPSDVRFAAAQAVWQAVGRRPEVEPLLGTV